MTIGLGAVAAIVAIHVPGLACELKHGPRTGAADAGVRKLPRAPDTERVRTAHHDAIYYVPVPSRRVILQ
jgi:hypothetical protein